MKKLTTIIKKHKWIFVTIFFFIAIMFAVSLISFSQISGVNGAVIGLSHWIKGHKFPFILWHILIIAAIYYFWGKKVETAAKRDNLSSDEIKKAKRFRYWMIAFVILVDLLIHWY